MNTMVSGAGVEWRNHYMLPIAAALGYATSVIHIYGLGPYIEPISETFGWSRTQTTTGLTIVTLVQAVSSIPMGMLVDRMGSRYLGVIGVLLSAVTFGLIGSATGSELNWYLLWAFYALTTLPVQATVWTSAVASRFEASRGLAFAITLCGASVGAALFPYMGTKLIVAYGWQKAIAIQSCIWIAFAFPIIFFFFRGARDRQVRPEKIKVIATREASGVSFIEGVRSAVYLRLFLASFLFTFTIVALVVHFVPILSGRGIDRLEAAGLASVIGLASIVGRLGTGFLLDRFSGSVVGAGVFLLPIIGCVLLLTTGSSLIGSIAAAVFIGLTLGAEVDVIVFLTSKHFGLKNFGALYGGLVIALSIGIASGPLSASMVFDMFGDYTPFLWLTVVFMGISSLSLASLPRPEYDL